MGTANVARHMISPAIQAGLGRSPGYKWLRTSPGLVWTLGGILPTASETSL